ncbi:family 78 glycoside hydrolase catalytic domain [Alicyclobacillus sp. SO9]|uniref:family 78 glycoside hydrolase catalytic domain n=1 Tax=Alicyclobacillus sp. SO9 TaxID=2665646 RepID=UPI0018E7808F|nr:family 78 glycoside hydrolase catalytic domain [Alicyclobacillus sp. SO9]QQE80561.1 family 78 glycoside hydrolase catalytic domain [Alicyclobacillus sp. SO9]
MQSGETQDFKTDFPKVRWRGKWISAPSVVGGRRTVSSAALGHTILFRKSFDVADSGCEKFPARVTADSRYILWLNGVEVSRGPIRSQPRRLTYDVVDLAPYLRSGRNVLCARVQYYGENTAWWMKADANLALGNFGVFAFEAYCDKDKSLISDDSWKATVSDAWSSVPMQDRTLSTAPLEVFDARRLSMHWIDLNFDDTGWSSAKIVAAEHMGSLKYDSPPTDPYGPMRVRPISKLTTFEKTSSVHSVHVVHDELSLHSDPVKHVLANLAADNIQSVAAKPDFPVAMQVAGGCATVIIVDFGREVAGTLRIALDAPEGTVVDVAASEALSAFASANQHTGFRYIARGQEDSFESFDPMGMRYAKVCITGTHECRVESVTIHERLYPFTDRGSFISNDSRLNSIFEAGVRTVSLTSHDAFIDCPSREQRAWIGDSVVHQLVHLTVNADWKLAIWNPQLANSPRYDGILPMSVAGDSEAAGGVNIPEWSLHWISSVYNLYRYVGDKVLVASLLPSVERVLRWFLPYQNEQGLLEHLPEWVLVDWSTVMREGASSILNAHFALGLWQFSEMAAWLEDAGRAKWATTIWSEIRNSFDVFWDPKREAYVDNIVNGIPGRAISQLAQALPVCGRLVPPERFDALLRNMVDKRHLTCKSWLADVFERFISEAPNLTSEQDGNELLLESIVNGSMDINVDWDMEQESVEAQPFMRYMVHDAVVLAGGPDKIADLCLDWGSFLDAEGDTFWELWTGGSLCHGWSSTPTRDLIQYTLGVTPATPGFESARIAPRLGHLEWAKGQVPTPYGFITVHIDKHSILVESPVPFHLDLSGDEELCFPAGRHSLDRVSDS